MDRSAVSAEANGVDPRDILGMTAEIVSSYVSKNNVRASELPEVIAAVHASLIGLAAPQPAKEPEPELKPAVPIKKSVTDEFIVSLEDGRKFKSMKRYLAGLGMTPDEYRRKWGLPRDYPIVAPGYAAKRSELAKLTGLGSSRRSSLSDVQPADNAEREAEPAAPQPAAQVENAPAAAVELADEAAPKKRGRAKKST